MADPAFSQAKHNILYRTLRQTSDSLFSAPSVHFSVPVCPNPVSPRRQKNYIFHCQDDPNHEGVHAMRSLTRKNGGWLRKATSAGRIPLLLAQVLIALFCVPETLKAGAVAIF